MMNEYNKGLLNGFVIGIIIMLLISTIFFGFASATEEIKEKQVNNPSDLYFQINPHFRKFILVYHMFHILFGGGYGVYYL